MGNGSEISKEISPADMPVQSENIAFRADELIACTKCGKANPPNRASCLYCIAPIELPEQRRDQVKINLRRLENWEKGHNIIFLPPAHGADVAGISRLLAGETDVVENMLAATQPFPLARIESASEADIAIKQLEKLGVTAKLVSDEEMHTERPPTRLRGIEFRDRSIVVTAFNTGEKTEIDRDDLLLVVSGSLIESKTESVEKRKKTEAKLLLETETTADEPLIDIYSVSDTTGFRIPAKGFDFSCLGEEKGLLASANMERLTTKLVEFSPVVRLADEYRAVARTLSTVWHVDRQKDFQGLTRTGIGRSGFVKVARTSNLNQFTKYSRLQRHLL